MSVQSCKVSDLDTLFWFYDQAIAYQKKVFNKHWLGFERDRVTREIAEGRQFKVMLDGEVAAVFVITHDDPLIWKELDKDKAVYLHRIVTHPDHRGKGIVPMIRDWALDFCKDKNLDFIRLDTWLDNTRLVAYYESCGFQFVRNAKLDDISDLPSHYQWELALLQIPVSPGNP
jgi:ribosomal protein S18 acetylase RimI-like enzyme